MCVASALAALLLASACAAPAPVTPTPLPFFGNGYRSDGDACRRPGEPDRTMDDIDHTADLLGCPVDPQLRAERLT